MLARRIAQVALSRMHEGQLTILEQDRSATHGPGGTPVSTLTVHDARFWPAVLYRGSVGLGEAYAEGWFDSDSLSDLIRLAHLNLAPITTRRDRFADLVAPLRDRLPRSSRGRDIDRANIAAHYDRSNDFFALMLDHSMAYSCALFEEPALDLEAAQYAKFDRLCQLLELGPDDHLLEIGTGWGGLAIHAASHFGCRVTTTTISVEQQEHAAKRVSELGLSDRIDVQGRDYRDLEGTFDKVVSVEMIEAVDWKDHDEFFSTLADRVRPGGRVALQAIVIADRSYERAKRHRDFIKAFIFPGGCLPSVASITRSTEATGQMKVIDMQRIGHHYPTTLRQWQANIDRHRDEIGRLGFNERVMRVWDLYLAYCAGAFETRQIDVVHVVLTKENHHGPLPHDNRVFAAS